MKPKDARIALASLSAAVLVGCATVGAPNPQQPHREPHHFTGRFMMSLDPAYLDRYTCPDGRPLMCVCTSLRAGTCDCSC